MVNIIKVVHKDNVRRLTLPSDASWIELEAKLRPLFHIPALTPFTLSYTDEDNDVITLSTDIELREILSTTPNVKFNLKFSSPDDASDSEDSNSEVWVLEGRDIIPRKKDVSIETDNPVLPDNVSPKNIISTTNQEPQYENSSDIQESPQYLRGDKNETSSVKSQVKNIDDDFEKVEKSPIDLENAEEENDFKKEETPSNDFKKEETPSNDFKREETPSNDFKKEETPSNDLEKSENSLNDVKRTEGPSKDFERTERSPIDFRRAEIPSNDTERTERPSGKKTSLVNLLDDEFFDSLNVPFNITPSFASSKPKPIPEPKPQDELNDTEENYKGIISETSSSTSNSFFSTEQNQQQRSRHNQNPNTNEPHPVEQFKVMIDQYGPLIKDNPDLTESIKNTMEQIRSSIPTDQDFLLQNTDNKRNFRQRSITPPIPGRRGHGRSPTPPRRGHGRSATPPRRAHGRSATPPRRAHGRSVTPPRRGYSRSVTPPILPGSYPNNTPPSATPATPCLWINESTPNPSPNPNHNGGARRNRGRGRGRRGRNNRNNNQKSKEGTPERGETPERGVTPERGETPEREVTPKREPTPEPPELINSPFYEQMKILNSMGFGKYKEDYEEMLRNYEGSIEAVVEVFVRRDDNQ